MKALSGARIAGAVDAMFTEMGRMTRKFGDDESLSSTLP
jgi:hypothetical protein